MFNYNNILKKIKITIITILIGIILVSFIIFSPILNIGYLNITGNNTISRENVLKIIKIDEPLNIFNVSTNEIKTNLENDLRIDKAEVSREGFNKINIDIKERRPLVTFKSNYGFVDVNYEGIILDAYKEAKKDHLPMIDGYIVQDLYIGDKLNNSNFNNLFTYLQYLAKDYEKDILDIDVKNMNNIIYNTNYGAKIILGTLDNPIKLAKESNSIFGEIKKTDLPLDYINFAYKKPVLKFK